MEITNTNVVAANELLSSLKSDIIQKSQLIRIAEVSALTTLAKSSINLWVAQSKFPKPISLSATVKVWKLEDISNWIEAQKTSNGSLRGES